MKELYLVTGATGHLGNTVAHRLARAGRQVRALVLPGEEHAPQLPGGVEAVAGDVRSPASLEALFAGAEGRDVTVIHCAGIVSIASRFDQNVYDVNVTGTKNVVDACVRRGVKKLVHVSSVHALPEKPGGALVSETDVFSPGAVVGLYAKTKAAATAYALAALCCTVCAALSRAWLFGSVRMACTGVFFWAAAAFLSVGLCGRPAAAAAAGRLQRRFCGRSGSRIPHPLPLASKRRTLPAGARRLDGCLGTARRVRASMGRPSPLCPP